MGVGLRNVIIFLRHTGGIQEHGVPGHTAHIAPRVKCFVHPSTWARSSPQWGRSAVRC